MVFFIVIKCWKSLDVFLGVRVYIDFRRLHSIAFQARKLSDDYTFIVVLRHNYDSFSVAVLPFNFIFEKN